MKNKKDSLLLKASLEKSRVLSNSGKNPTSNIEELSHNIPLLIDRIIICAFSWEFHDLSKTSMDRLAQQFRFKTDPMNEAVAWKKKSMKLEFASQVDMRIYYYSKQRMLRISAHIHLNPTRQIRRSLTDCTKSDAKAGSLDNSDNWLPDEVIDHIGKYHVQKLVVNETTTMIQKTLQCIRDMIGLGSRVEELGPILSIRSVEIYKDIKCNNSLLFLRAHANSFGSHFRSINRALYRTSCINESISRNGMCLSGSHRKGERHKMYAKTPTLVRIESVYTSSRIRQILGTNVIGSNMNRCFQNAIASLKVEFQATFHNILSSLESSQHQFGSLLQQFYFIARSSPSIDKFYTLISILSSNGRIASTHGLYKQVYRLSKCGVLEKTERGLYRADKELIKLLGVLSENDYGDSGLETKQDISQ